MLLAAGLLLVASLVGLRARQVLQERISRWRQVPARSGLSGVEVARALLAEAGLAGSVGIARAEGVFADHYDPRTRTLHLSAAVHDGRDVAAAGIAAHEVGHALQQAAEFRGLRLRGFAVPFARIGGYLGLPLVLLGVALRLPPVALLGLALYAAVVLFQVLALPVEVDASRRAVQALGEARLVETEEEAEGIRGVLNAAAATYLAAAVAGLAMLIWGALLGGRRG